MYIQIRISVLDELYQAVFSFTRPALIVSENSYQVLAERYKKNVYHWINELSVKCFRLVF